mmetsp:Transcript_19893/g.60066  ORF Transcript_19893/g.60066 Transcript_19893/m.60066 type:complete len:432 (-) Transcript_19893:1327-2622(-)
MRLKERNPRRTPEIAGQVFLHPNQLGSKLVARPKSSIILQPADDLELPFESQVWHRARMQRQRYLERKKLTAQFPEPQPQLGLARLALNASKTCERCSKEWPMRFFPLKPTMEDGHLSICFGCKSELLQESKPTLSASELEEERQPTNKPYRCKDCGYMLPASFFHIHNSTKTRRYPTCQACVSAAYHSKAKYTPLEAQEHEPKICTKCGVMKSRSEFSKMSHALDGKQPHCKRCKALYRRIRTRRSTSTSSISIPVEAKTCVRCTKTKPAKDFPLDKRNRDGLHAICRPCFYHRYQKPKSQKLAKLFAKSEAQTTSEAESEGQADERSQQQGSTQSRDYAPPGSTAYPTQQAWPATASGTASPTPTGPHRSGAGYRRDGHGLQPSPSAETQSAPEEGAALGSVSPTAGPSAAVPLWWTTGGDRPRDVSER